ncbi:glycosyltransferase [Xylanimonas allomyrinae]|uniref:Glycosyltransferase n=1 Tax=Xylanimonas allomyrinae TaxID=2509459 RepID=A0A4P6EMP5_9MICO|nr:glycosyltransferase [Xylanimonas allomyrinae]QAY63616.1 glycosyltransferase [Xylanimonas allomyrinae]
MILDEFSMLAFAPEWVQVPVAPDDWMRVLDAEMPDLLFVESAWNGNDGAWLHHVVGPTAPRPALVGLVAECRERRIPTVFWNKEDPPHFSDFLATAALFDLVLTTDVNCVAEYKRRLGHDRVGVLPFAAQARYHNPTRPQGAPRDREVAFGGMYFRHKYPERREQLDYLLPAARRHTFDIFSRHAESTNQDYQFPSRYAEHVRGSLTYPQMLHAYHRYRVFLNVNSVVDSASMCARRIFEVSACGASVLTPPSPAVDGFFPEGEIPVVSNEAEATTALRTLLRSEEYRERQVHRAQRRIWEAHTYTDRVGAVLDAVRMPDPYTRPSTSVIVSTVRPENVTSVLENVGRQVGVSPELVLLCHGFSVDGQEVRAIARDLGIDELTLLEADAGATLGENLNELVRASSGDMVSKMDDDDFYGPNYLRDLLNASYYSEADIVGKAASYIYFESKDATVLSYESHANRYTDFVRGATLTGKRDLFAEVGFEALACSEDSTFLAKVRAGGGRIYGADRFNFVIRRVADPESHTWRVSDDELFSAGRYVVSGAPFEHVCV